MTSASLQIPPALRKLMQMYNITPQQLQKQPQTVAVQQPSVSRQAPEQPRIVPPTPPATQPREQSKPRTPPPSSTQPKQPQREVVVTRIVSVIVTKHIYTVVATRYQTIPVATEYILWTVCFLNTRIYSHIFPYTKVHVATATVTRSITNVSTAVVTKFVTSWSKYVTIIVTPPKGQHVGPGKPGAPKMT